MKLYKELACTTPLVSRCSRGQSAPRRVSITVSTLLPVLPLLQSSVPVGAPRRQPATRPFSVRSARMPRKKFQPRRSSASIDRHRRGGSARRSALRNRNASRFLPIRSRLPIDLGYRSISVTDRSRRSELSLTPGERRASLFFPRRRYASVAEISLDGVSFRKCALSCRCRFCLGKKIRETNEKRSRRAVTRYGNIVRACRRYILSPRYARTRPKYRRGFAEEEGVSSSA